MLAQARTLTLATPHGDQLAASAPRKNQCDDQREPSDHEPSEQVDPERAPLTLSNPPREIRGENDQHDDAQSAVQRGHGPTIVRVTRTP